jgi:hypothetical protein
VDHHHHHHHRLLLQGLRMLDLFRPPGGYVGPSILNVDALSRLIRFMLKLSSQFLRVRS